MEEKQRITVINVNLSQVDLPTFNEQRNLDWVKYGSDNLFPNKLQELSNRSALHNAIISSKVDNACGIGVTYSDEEHKKTEMFIASVNGLESLEDFIRKISYDYILYGGYAINVIWSKDHKSIAEIHHIDFSKIRCGKQNERGEIETYWYSKDWANYRKSEYEPQEIPAFSFDIKKRKAASQLMYVKEYRPGADYYPLPSYVGALAYIEIDTEIANFHLAHIKNGMQPSIMINFNNGIPTTEERKKIERQIESKYNGTDNAGKFILTFSDDKDKAPTVTTLTPSQLDKQFIQLQDTVLQNILSGHKVVSPMIVGIKTEGQLGGANELENAFNIYTNTVIRPIQEIVLRSINTITRINGLMEISIIPSTPVEFSFSEGVLTTIMTKNEMREKIGLPKIEFPDPSSVDNEEETE